MFPETVDGWVLVKSSDVVPLPEWDVVTRSRERMPSRKAPLVTVPEEDSVPSVSVTVREPTEGEGSADGGHVAVPTGSDNAGGRSRHHGDGQEDAARLPPATTPDITLAKRKFGRPEHHRRRFPRRRGP
jgi:hypothetical protein